MGLIISRFRKQPIIKDKLKSLVKEIKDIEDFLLYTQKRQKNIVGRFVLLSVTVLIAAAVAFYFLYLPERITHRVLYAIPFFFCPFIIVFLKRMITWYFSRKITRNEKRLAALREEKKKLLENVMDTETYKKAKEILEQFAPEQLRKETSTALVPKVDAPLVRSSPMARNSFAPDASQDLRRRNVMPAPTTPRPGIQATPTPAGWRNMPLATPNTPFQQRPNLPPGPPMPRPILPRERSTMDKLVEFIVGDGPSNRYALVCRQCASHNGMALQEEFEYLAFRCCYCYAWNPARKQRPQAPLLPVSASSQEEEESSPSTASSDTEGEEKEQVKTETQTDNQTPSQECEPETSQTLPTPEPSAPEDDTTSSETKSIEETETTTPSNPDS